MPNHPTTPLASGQVNHDRLTVELIRPTDSPPIVAISWPSAATFATPEAYPATAAAITRIIASSTIALARWKAHGK